MSAPTRLQSLRKTVVRLFPWMGRFGLDDASKRLQVRSDGTGLDLEGGGPAVARVGDIVVRLCLRWDSSMVAPILYVSESVSPPYVWTAVAAVSGAPPTTANAGTPVTIAAGSGKVHCG